MNAVNRVLVVVLILVTMAVCSILLLVPTWALGAISQQSAALVDFLNTVRWYVRLPLGILFALTLDIVLVLLIIAEVRRPAPRFISVEKAAGGEVQVSISSIADQLKYEIDQLPSVLSTEPKVSGQRRGVAVQLDVETAAGIDVPEKADEIVEAAERVVEEKMGLKLARPPRVNLRTVPYPTAPKAPARAAGAKRLPSHEEKE